MIEQILIIVGAGIFGILGSAHLLFTFFTDKFLARKAEVVSEMKNTTPILTDQTTMWKAWIGFNASHSLGAIIFSLLYLILSIFHMDLFFTTTTFIWLAVVNSISYLFLAKRYWFKDPFIGILIATFVFFLAAILIEIKMV
ncbi:MAG: hypothetical protein D8M58_21020 [Calditrichaeota bacterium]|nr:MAG: hypothetical protein DWQ03_16735 [Calditrichota bacterium]MBL1207894.1 hypothetical protein [Calditrichota bacterium]NOG47729.1 hypothetical protein [Calditrichota bacterium]